MALIEELPLVPPVREEIDLSRYPRSEGHFNVSSYCEEALMDRRGSLQLNR